MELKQFLHLLVRWLWLIVLTISVAGAIARGVSEQTVPIYGASTTVLINQAPANSSTVDLNALRTSESLAKTYVALLYKRPVLEAVVKNLKLDMSPQQLAQKTRVATVRDTQLIVLTVEDTDPQRAADIANEIVRVFSQQTRELQASRYAASKENLEQELTRIHTDINFTQTRLELLKDATAPDEVAEQHRLQVLVAEHSSSYATVLNSYEGVRLAEAQTTDNLKVVEEAQVETMPVRPKVLQDTLLGIGVGAMIGIGLVFLIGYLDTSVKSSEAAAELTGVPTLASIARMKGRDGSDKLITVLDGGSSIGEAYRMLRANIDFSAIDEPIHTIVVTSGSSGEGKGTTAANLAVVFAKTGRKVILVDADLRRPALHKLFKQTNERGLTMALLRQIADPIDNYLVPTEVDNLYLMPSGPPSPNPAELLGSQQMIELIGKLKAQTDIVIFDSPPVLPVVDTMLLARACDATILVVLAASTRVEALKKAKDRLIQSGAHLVGIVFNRAPQSESYNADYLSEPKPLKPRERLRRRIHRLFRGRGADMRPAPAQSNEVHTVVTATDDRPPLRRKAWGRPSQRYRGRARVRNQLFRIGNGHQPDATVRIGPPDVVEPIDDQLAFSYKNGHSEQDLSREMGAAKQRSASNGRDGGHPDPVAPEAPDEISSASNLVPAKGETTAILIEQPNPERSVASPKPRVNANGNGRHARRDKAGRS